MLRQNYWKLILSAVVVLWAVLELIPLKDQPFGDYVKSEASAKKVQFATLMTKVSERIAAARAQGRELSTYIALKQIGREEQLDLSEYFPQIRLEDKLKNKEKRNDILLGELLRRSKGSVQLGLDLKGGIAITLEMDPAAASALSDRDREEKLKKAVEIIDMRSGRFDAIEVELDRVGGVVERVAQAGGEAGVGHLTRDRPLLDR